MEDQVVIWATDPKLYEGPIEGETGGLAALTCLSDLRITLWGTNAEVSTTIDTEQATALRDALDVWLGWA